MATRLLRHDHLLGFLFVATAVYGVSFVLAQRLETMDQAGTLAVGMTLDLVILVPLAFYVLVVRRSGHSPLRVLPVLVVGLLLAGRLVPPDHQQTLNWLELIVAPAELGFIGWILWRVSRVLGAGAHQGQVDPLDQLSRASHDLIKNPWVANLLTSELAMIQYGLLSWRKPAHQPEASRAFFQHQRSGLGAMVFAFLMLMVGEGVAVHLLLGRWSAVLAWIFTASTVYAAVWLWADYRATVKRPILIMGQKVVLRVGLRHNAEVSRDNISDICRQEPDTDKLKFPLIGAPTHWVIFHDPVVVLGPYGLKKTVQAVGLCPDDPESFARELMDPGVC